MANIRNSNTYYVDTSSSAGTASSFVSGERNLKLIGVVYTAGAGTDALLVSDMAVGGSIAVGATKLNIKASVAGETKQIRLEDTPLVFPNGIWVTLTGTPSATLIFSQQGN